MTPRNESVDSPYTEAAKIWVRWTETRPREWTTWDAFKAGWDAAKSLDSADKEVGTLPGEQGFETLRRTIIDEIEQGRAEFALRREQNSRMGIQSAGLMAGERESALRWVLYRIDQLRVSPSVEDRTPPISPQCPLCKSMNVTVVGKSLRCRTCDEVTAWENGTPPKERGRVPDYARAGGPVPKGRQCPNCGSHNTEHNIAADLIACWHCQTVSDPLAIPGSALPNPDQPREAEEQTGVPGEVRCDVCGAPAWNTTTNARLCSRHVSVLVKRVVPSSGPTNTGEE